MRGVLLTPMARMSMEAFSHSRSPRFTNLALSSRLPPRFSSSSLSATPLALLPRCTHVEQLSVSSLTLTTSIAAPFRRAASLHIIIHKRSNVHFWRLLPAFCLSCTTRHPPLSPLQKPPGVGLEPRHGGTPVVWRGGEQQTAASWSARRPISPPPSMLMRRLPSKLATPPTSTNAGRSLVIEGPSPLFESMDSPEDNDGPSSEFVCEHAPILFIDGPPGS